MLLLSADHTERFAEDQPSPYKLTLYGDLFLSSFTSCPVYGYLLWLRALMAAVGEPDIVEKAKKTESPAARNGARIPAVSKSGTACGPSDIKIYPSL